MKGFFLTKSSFCILSFHILYEFVRTLVFHFIEIRVFIHMRREGKEL